MRSVAFVVPGGCARQMALQEMLGCVWVQTKDLESLILQSPTWSSFQEESYSLGTYLVRKNSFVPSKLYPQSPGALREAGRSSCLGSEGRPGLWGQVLRKLSE